MPSTTPSTPPSSSHVTPLSSSAARATGTPVDMTGPRMRLHRQLSLLVLLLASSFLSAQEIDSDNWIPPRADALAALVDRLEQARADNNENGIRDTLQEFARRITDGVVPGGLALSDERWVGAATYLADLLALLDGGTRERVQKDIDTYLEGRLARENWRHRGSLPRRLARDFPDSRLATKHRQLHRELLLESGLIKSYLQATPDIKPEWEAQLRALLPPDTPPAESPAGNVFDLTRRISWPELSDTNTLWGTGTLWRQPVIVGDRILLQDSDRLRCLNLDRGRAMWTTDFLENFPRPQVGAVVRPVVAGTRVVTTSRSAITAFDLETGFFSWERPITTLLADDTELHSAIHVTPPIATPEGIVLAALFHDEGTLRARLVCLSSADGSVQWNQSAGSASGATYLGLGAGAFSLAVEGQRVLCLTHRGTLSAFDLTDGAFLWSVRYPNYTTRGSRDALRFSDRPYAMHVEARYEHVVGAPLDSASLHLWRSSDGERLLSIPRNGARWWTWAAGDSSAPVALCGERSFSLWRLHPTPELLGHLDLPNADPDFTGAPTFAAGEWWIPHRRGYYQVGTQPIPGRQLRYQHHEVPVPFNIDQVLPVDDQLLVSNPHNFALLSPTARPSDPVLLAEKLLARGQGGELYAALRELSESDLRLVSSSVERLAEAVLDSASAFNLGLDDETFQEIVDLAITLLPRGSRRAQAAFDRAVSAASQEQWQDSIRFLYMSLQSPPETKVRVATDFQLSLELAVHHFLQRLALEDVPDAVWATIHDEAQEALQSAGNSTPEVRSVARRYPGIPAGRRATLALADSYARAGNDTQALLLLQKLMLFDSASDESVEARLRLVELYCKVGQIAESHALLAELSARFPNYEVVKAEGTPQEQTLSIREVTEKLAKDLPQVPETGDTPRRRASHEQLIPSWRLRTELQQQEHAEIFPLDTLHPDLPHDQYLVAGKHTVELRESLHGRSLWVRHFPPTPRETPGLGGGFGNGFGFRFDASLSDFRVAGGRLYFHDTDFVHCLDLESGKSFWKWAPDKHWDDAGGTGPRLLYYRCSSERMVVADADGGLHAVLLADGTTTWSVEQILEQQMNVNDELVAYATVEVEEGEIDATTFRGYAVQVRSMATGDVVQTIRWPNLVTVADTPTFNESGQLVISLLGGNVTCYDPRTAEEIWTRTLPGKVHRMHQFHRFPHWVCEMQMRGSSTEPSLVGIDPRDGRMLWQSRLRRSGNSELTLTYERPSLFVLQGEYNSRRAARIDFPAALLRPGGSVSLPPDLELEPTWDVALSGGGFSPTRLRLDDQFVLIEETNNCNILVLSRATGKKTQPARFKFADEFLRARQRLFFGGFIDGTLVLHTNRGSVGLRTVDPMESLQEVWELLRHIDPWLRDSQQLAPEDTAYVYFQRGQLLAACEVLESILRRPGVALAQRARVTRTLEGFAQELAEARPPSWRVPRMDQAPVVDAALDEEWHPQHAVPLEAPRFVHPMQGVNEQPGSWSGWRDLSCLVFTGWSSDGFHLALDVTDDSVHPYDRDQPRWMGDCLLLAFDFNADGGLTARPDDQLLTLALTVPRPQRDPDKSDDEENPDDPNEEDAPDPDEDEADPEGQFQVRRKADGSGVVYEVTIPWGTFRKARAFSNEVIPRPNLQFGFNVVLTDDDAGTGARSYMSLSSGQMLSEQPRNVWNLFAPQYFAVLSLSP